MGRPLYGCSVGRSSSPNQTLSGFLSGHPSTPFVSQVMTALQEQPVETEIEMPAQLVAGLSVRPTQALSGDYQWVGWSAFDSVTLDFSKPIPPDEEFVQNYHDTTRCASAQRSRHPDVRLRAGYAYNQAAAPDETVTPLLPEARRNHLTVGGGWTVDPRSRSISRTSSSLMPIGAGESSIRLRASCPRRPEQRPLPLAR